MSMSIGVHGKGKGRTFEVSTTHRPDGVESNPEPYDAITITVDSSSLTLYLEREQTDMLRRALTKLAVDHPTP
jgi:hypothetical protein